MALNIAVKSLDEVGVEVLPDPEIEIVNIVASADIGTELNLNQVAIALGLENIEYEPEQFPGLVYRLRIPKVVLLLFSTGKIICTGARNKADLYQAVSNLRTELTDLGFL
jgi:transcription initiation factor TFIID TATA-box-binding protein